MSHDCFRIGAVILNAGTKEVTHEGTVVPLPPLSFNLLHVLARHAPNVVTVTQLEDEVWSGLVVDRGTINKRVLLVRNALSEAGCEGDYITVVRGTGYRLSVPVERMPEILDKTDPASTGASTANVMLVRGRWLAAGAGAMLVLVLGWNLVPGTGGLGAVTAPGIDQTTRTGQPPGARHRVGSASLAVLPFEDLGSAGADGYLGDGVAREIITLLNGMDGLEVASQYSSFALRDTQEPVASVAGRLRVKSVLKGSVQREGEQIRVTTRLIDAATGENLWTASYSGSLDTLFQVQDDIAANVAMALQVSPADGERPDSRLGRTANVEAFTHFLKGRALMDDRIAQGIEGLQQSRLHFQSAIDIDPGFDRAYVGLASAYYLMPAYDSELDRESHLQQAEAHARFALELNPKSGEALGVLAAILFRRGEAAQAAALFDRARERGGADPNVMHWAAMLFTSMGYFEKLVPTLEEALRLDPLNTLLGCSLASALNLSGHPEQSVAIFSSLERFARRDVGLALAGMYLGNFDSARELLREVRLLTGVLPGDYADQLVAAIEDPRRYPLVEQHILAAGREGALDRLVAFEALLIMGSPAAFDLGVDFAGTPFEYRLPEPVWNNWGFRLRRDPRFKDWVRALGYDQYWRKNGWPDRCRPTGLADFECV